MRLISDVVLEEMLADFGPSLVMKILKPPNYLRIYIHQSVVPSTWRNLLNIYAFLKSYFQRQ